MGVWITEAEVHTITRTCAKAGDLGEVWLALEPRIRAKCWQWARSQPPHAQYDFTEELLSDVGMKLVAERVICDLPAGPVQQASSWLQVVIDNCGRDMGRARSRFKRASVIPIGSSEDLVPIQAAAGQRGAEHGAIEGDFVQRLDGLLALEAMRSYSPRMALIVEARRDGKSSTEVAEVLGVTVRTVQRDIEAAVEFVEEFLGSRNGDDDGGE